MQGSQYEKFAKIYDTLMSDVDYDAWAEYLYAELIEQSVKRCVDCACGTGAITVRLKNYGLDMTGVDISEDMLEIAAENARNSGKVIPFVRMDMRHLALHKAQDAVIAACDGVNYLTSLRDVEKFFLSAYSVLKPSGIIAFDISSRYKLANILGCNTFAEDEGKCAYIWKNMYDETAHLLEMNLSFYVSDGAQFERFTETHIQRAHSVTEITNALSKAGFEDIRAYDFMTKEPCKSDSERIQFYAKRK